MKQNIIHIGLDVDDTQYHGSAFNKDTSEVVDFKSRPTLKGLLQQLGRMARHFKGHKIKLCYEASYIGYCLQRDLMSNGIHCDIVSPSSIPSPRGKAIKIISFLLRHLPDTNNYKVIVMRRELPEVLASQSKMLERRGEPNGTSDEQMIKIWKDHVWRTNYFLKHTPHFEFIDVSYRNTVADPYTKAVRIKAFLGLPTDAEKMATAVDPNLYRNRA